VFRLDDARPTPAHTMTDGVDYLPTRPAILFGHHFASITGLAPMLGPAVAVIWGWGPALVWVVLGAVFVGCVHDFAALVISVRKQGKSVGQVAEDILGARGRTLFHLIIFFGVALAMGVFVLVIAQLFSLQLAPPSEAHPQGQPGYPQAVLPSAFLMVLAMVSGILMYKKGLPLWIVAVVGFVLELVSIWVGLKLPTMGLAESMWPAADGWKLILLAYAFAASVLPVWALLQSRDFLNGLLLYLGLGLAYAGFFILRPAFDAPMLQAHPAGAPSILPFVFITIACGAASGFHGLVSSGTTAKQLDKESHARPIGYGGMIGESLLALLATLACTAGFASSELWHGTYSDWGRMQGLAPKIDAFIRGTTTFVSEVGLRPDLAAALIAMVVVSFALTTLDSATRLLRFNIEEIGASFRIPFSQNRYLSSALACGAIALFAFYKVDGRPAGIALWSLFGTTNQLLAGLTLVLVSLYLRRLGRPTWPTAVPAVFMLGSTLFAMGENLIRFAPGGASPDKVLFVVGGVLMLLGVWLLVETAVSLGRPLREAAGENDPR
jgi:carbon starvation protein